MQINFTNKNNKQVSIKATDKETFRNWVIYLQDKKINFTTICIKKNFIF